jgi:hypothetical protein
MSGFLHKKTRPRAASSPLQECEAEPEVVPPLPSPRPARRASAELTQDVQARSAMPSQQREVLSQLSAQSDRMLARSKLTGWFSSIAAKATTPSRPTAASQPPGAAPNSARSLRNPLTDRKWLDKA